MQELEQAGLLATPDQPTPRAPTLSDLNDLKYLNAIFHEGAIRKLTLPCPSERVESTRQAQSCVSSASVQNNAKER